MRRSALLLAGLLLLAGGAVASAKLKEKSTTFAIPADSTGEGAAKCKKGQEAVSGGFFDPINFFTGPFTLPLDLVRSGRREWSHRAHTFSSDDEQATVYAYCDSNSPRLKAKSATVSSDETYISVTARCRRGQEAVSGGFANSATDEFVLPLVSKRIGKRKWEVAFSNLSAVLFDVTAYVYCDKSEPRLKERSETITVESPNIESVTARCKRKHRVVSGGFEAEFSESGFIFPSVHTSRRDGKRGWEATGAVGMSEPAEITAYAYCEPKEGK
jgi:hypothetical protein